MKQHFITIEVQVDTQNQTITYNLEGREDLPIHLVEEVLTDVMGEIHKLTQSKPDLKIKDING